MRTITHAVDLGGVRFGTSRGALRLAVSRCRVTTTTAILIANEARKGKSIGRTIKLPAWWRQKV